MCKLLYISNYSEMNVSSSQLKAILNVMIDGNDDGLGIISEKGYVKTDNPDKIILGDKLDFLGYNYGSITSRGKLWEGKSLAVHSRISTNSLGVDYSHPFETDNSYFTHNGVVNILPNNFKLKTKNDSEFLAHYYETGIDNLKNIVGYYAYIRYDKNKNQWNIGRDDTAQLYYAQILNSDNFIISTKAEDIYLIVDILKLEIELIRSINNFTELTIKDNKVISTLKLPKMQSMRAKDKLYNISIGNELGKGLDVDDTEEYERWMGITNAPTNEELFEAYTLGHNDGQFQEYNDSHINQHDEWIEAYDEGYMDALNENKNKRIK